MLAIHDVPVAPLDQALELRPRSITAAQRRRFEESIAEIFTALGLDLDSPGAQRTPERFLDALIDITAGYDGDPKLVTTFDGEAAGPANQIVEGPIPFSSLCEHHGLPVHGEAYVGYIAGERILGISKLTRLVRVFARRFTVQERLGRQIVEALDAILEPAG